MRGLWCWSHWSTAGRYQFGLKAMLPVDPERWFDLEVEDGTEKCKKRALELKNDVQRIEVELALLLST